MKYERLNAEQLDSRIISFRREFHKYAESAWTEYRTTVRIIRELEQAGIPYLYGKAIHTTGERVSLRDPALEFDRDEAEETDQWEFWYCNL